MNAPLDVTRFGSGQAVRRIEDPALVRGQGRFTDDVVPAGQLSAVFVRSTSAHARLKAVDATEARAMPGVKAVFTGADLAGAGVKPIGLAPAFKRPDGQPMAGAPRVALAHETLHFVGQPVALVVAETRDQAQAAADAVVIDAEDLPAVVDPLQAVAPGAPVVWPSAPDNVCAEMRHGDAAGVDAAFAKAAHTVSLHLVNQRLAPCSMEPRSVLAWMDGERLTMRLSSQMPTAVRGGLAESIPGLSAEQVHVVVGDVGGGFGM
jgi:carbon-monoxide dehydrogenase large subunit